jgi:plastocyanin
MNTRKQVLIMTSLLLMMLVTIAVYAAWYPSRSEDSARHFEEATAERGTLLFARNCRLCHGDVGEGGALGARLPAAPALNRPDLQGFRATDGTLTEGLSLSATSFEISDATGFAGGDIILIDEERMEVTAVDGENLTVKRGLAHTDAAQHFADAVVYRFDATAFDILNPNSVLNVMTNTITCGRVGTAMPAWSQSHGGPLSDEQIRQLQVLIMVGRWDLVEHEVDVEDLIATELTEPVTADALSLFVSDVSVFNANEAIRIGEERLRVVAVPTLPRDRFGDLPKDRSGVLGVERGVLGTTPLEHGIEEELFRFPETPEPSINMAACGQTAREPAPAGDPELIEDFTGQTVEVSAFNVAFNTDEIRVNAGGDIRLRFENQEAVDHNIAVRASATDTTPVASGSVGLVFQGPAVDDTVFTLPAAGTYFFRCDVHPTLMTGEFIVQ